VLRSAAEGERNLQRWLRDVGEPIDTMLVALAEVRPESVLDAGSGDGSLAALLTAPRVVWKMPDLAWAARR
jgi:hypothetical protein